MGDSFDFDTAFSRLPKIEMPRYEIADFEIPPNPAFETNDLLGEIRGQLDAHGAALSQLAQLAALERDGRIAAERSARRWAWTNCVLGLVTLAAAVAGVLVGAL